MNAIEDRLTSALSARAEQVQPEDLATVEVPPVNWWKRPAGLILVAAACAALISAPFLVTGGDDEGAPADNPSQVTGEDDPALFPVAPDTIGVGETWQVPGGGIDTVSLEGEVEYDGQSRNPRLVVSRGKREFSTRLRGLAQYRVVTTLLSGDVPLIAVERRLGGNQATYEVFGVGDPSEQGRASLRALPVQSQVRQDAPTKLGEQVTMTFNWVSEEGVLYTSRTGRAKVSPRVRSGAGRSTAPG